MIDDLIAALRQPTGTSSSGYPYLAEHAWVRIRDWVPHTLDSGHAVWLRLDALEGSLGPGVAMSARVIRQVVNTAAITAPPDLWLMRGVLSAMASEGLLKRFGRGEVIVPSQTDYLPEELRIDLEFLVSRGVLLRHREGFRASEAVSARALMSLPVLDSELPTDITALWTQALRGDGSAAPQLRMLFAEAQLPPGHPSPCWIATPRDVVLGWRLVPLVLALRAAGLIPRMLEENRINHEFLRPLDERVSTLVLALLRSVGAVNARGGLTRPGARMLRRGPGPFGIIETYAPYVSNLPQLWREGRGVVHVRRGENVAASRDANRRTFYDANESLDSYCASTGFRYSVFIEHAVGCGEALRQRWTRSGDGLRYVGADLESEALQATVATQAAGQLPADLVLIQADIGDPGALVRALEAEGLSAHGAVMMVGNGFHEVRVDSDAQMVEVFRGYAKAGIVLLFTEESALSLEDLLATAWNTYHAGFKYVHERSGQGLRPAIATLSRMGPTRASWTECAERAGYRRLERWCSRSRTIYPHPTADGRNPSISENHFFMPPMRG
jgi:hypothetical protein